jgi:hypothetical protein
MYHRATLYPPISSTRVPKRLRNIGQIRPLTAQSDAGKNHMSVAKLEQSRVRAHRTVDAGIFLFLLKELFAVFALAVIVFLVLGVLWLAYTRAIYLLFVSFAIINQFFH